MQAGNKNNLPNLNSLRFIAASLVVFGHVNHALFFNGYVSSHLFIFSFASLAVVFFFVLSGFLITYLLLKEKQERKISVKHFYIKRILRIWPVYYVVVIVAFGFFNASSFFHWHQVTDIVDVSKHPVLSCILLLCICPNIVLLYSRGLGYANPAWSIGVEEQFYLIWPWIMRSKRPLVFIIAIIVMVYLLRLGALMSIINVFHVPFTLHKVAGYVSRFFTFEFSFRIDAMAVGALGAFAAYKKISLLKIIFAKYFQWFLYTLLAVVIIFPGVVPSTFYSIIFMLIILNMAINEQTIIDIEHKIFNYLGKISYGIYMYHSFTVIPVIYLVYNVLGLTQNIYTEFIICVVALIFTVAFASLSYFYFERYFLRIKEKIDKKYLL